MKLDLVVLIKGAGEMASGVAWRLFNSGFKVVMTEAPRPLAVRRAVSYSEVLYTGSKVVEGVEARLVDDPDQVAPLWEQGVIPVVVDPKLTLLERLRPPVLLEATVAKRNTGIRMDMAPLVIALGPGYQAGVDAHFVVETNRGHNLGRIYRQGRAEPNTGIPGTIAGKSWERVLRAPTNGVFQPRFDLGDMVEQGQVVATVAEEPVVALVGGILRGLLRGGVDVVMDQKLGDVDPRGEMEFLHTISEKARCIGGSVLEAILRVYNR